MDVPADVRALFEAPNYAHLATVLPDGGPHNTVPVWVGIEDGKIAFLTSPDSRKARNLAADPRVAIWVTDHDNPYKMAQVRGRVTAWLDGEPAWDVIDRLSRKYTGPPYPLRTGRVVLLTGAIEITVHGWDISVACGARRPVPPALAAVLLPIAALLITPGTRPGLFADPVRLPGPACPDDQLVAFLGRQLRPPGRARARRRLNQARGAGRSAAIPANPAGLYQ
jgi:PPOX class probable F420-dependent enzyme